MAKRGNPVENATSRVKEAAAKVDSVMQARMPKSFQKAVKGKASPKR